MELTSMAAAQPIGHPAAETAVAAVAPAPTLVLGIGDQPGSICALNATTCTAAASESRVQMSVSAVTPLTSYPAVEIAFVIETDAFDGVYDPTLQKLPPAGLDPCVKAVSNGPLCEESNGVPFFEDFLPQISDQITVDNPHTTVSFAMLDFQGTCDQWDDGCYEHPLIHIDDPIFEPAGPFAQTATQSFKEGLLDGGYVYSGEDLADPFLHISSITALYGALNGGIFNWTPNTHHVIVLMGSAAPRDPSYPENYCVSSTAWYQYDYYSGCIAPTCEPSYQFPSGYSPNCEGWVRSQDGNPSDSIAALAHQAPQCQQSTGGACTIDVIDLFDTPTDALSQGWPLVANQKGDGPGGSVVEEDATNILLAGCALAAATGGSWDGPIFFSCPDGSAGGLQYVPHGPINTPNTWNPTLMNAFRTIGFGPVLNPIVAIGTDKPMFNFVPFGNIAVAPNPAWATACSTPQGYSPDCQVTPSISTSDGTRSYGWNWSTNATHDEIAVGDQWTVAFNVVNVGPPYTTVPVDACITPTCGARGSGALNGVFTSAVYNVPNVTGVVVQSFPLAEILVTSSGVISATPPIPSPPPVVGPSIPLPVPSATPTPVLVLITLSTSLGTFSTQPIAGGLLAAVFTRVMIKQRPMAVSQAVLSGGSKGAGGSKFEPAAKGTPGVGRME
jgi:hypothetical protein